MDLKEMRRAHKALGVQIAQAELALEEKKKAKQLADDYAKVVCSCCCGTGERSEGGADIESDPPFAVTCGGCGGDGFVYAQLFTGKADYDLKHHQVHNED